MTWATSLPILVFLGLSVFDLGPMYATDRLSDRRQTASSLNAPAYSGRGIIIEGAFLNFYGKETISNISNDTMFGDLD